MKKLICVAVVALAGMVVFSSCGKQCSCARYEDGKKVLVNTDKEVRYYEPSICKSYSSEKPYQGMSVVTDGKEVTIEYKCK